MKLFLSIAGALAWVFGSLLLFVPDKFYEPTGIAMTPLLATIAQAHGATLVGLGTVLWFARSLKGHAIAPILVGNAVVQLLSLLVVLRTMTLGAGLKVLPGVFIHVILGSFFVYFWMRERRH